MSRLLFDHSTGRLWAHGAETLGPFPAANFVDSTSAGPWSAGIAPFVGQRSHEDDGPESPFGSHGILIFGVPGRSDMGVHSGRRSTADALGRTGPSHCTMGCIRTTDEAMAQIAALHQRDHLTEIEVQRWPGAVPPAPKPAPPAPETPPAPVADPRQKAVSPWSKRSQP